MAEINWNGVKPTHPGTKLPQKTNDVIAMTDNVGQDHKHQTFQWITKHAKHIIRQSGILHTNFGVELALGIAHESWQPNPVIRVRRQVCYISKRCRAL